MGTLIGSENLIAGYPANCTACQCSPGSGINTIDDGNSPPISVLYAVSPFSILPFSSSIMISWGIPKEADGFVIGIPQRGPMLSNINTLQRDNFCVPWYFFSLCHLRHTLHSPALAHILTSGSPMCAHKSVFLSFTIKLWQNLPIAPVDSQHTLPLEQL